MCESCCGLNAPPFRLALHRLNPFSYLFPAGHQEREEERERVEEMGTMTVPNPLPSPEEDAEKLRKACQGWGTDEKAIIEVLGHRSAPQRLAIAEAYQRLYNESLLDRLHSELSGDFRKAVILWTRHPAERDAKLVNKALTKKGDRDIWVIIEVACASSPDHLVAVRQAYHSLFFSSLEEDVAHHFAKQQPLVQFLVRLVSSYRYPGENVNEELAKFEAAELFDAIKEKEPHREGLIRIITTRSKSQLMATFNQYKQDYGKDIDEEIEGLGGNQFAAFLKVAVWCLASPEKHFAEVVRSSVLGLGTDEDSLSRAIITRAEIDMKKIKEEYKNRYKTTLSADVIDDTSGDYKDFLLTLVGGAD